MVNALNCNMDAVPLRSNVHSFVLRTFGTNYGQCIRDGFSEAKVRHNITNAGVCTRIIQRYCPTDFHDDTLLICHELLHGNFRKYLDEQIEIGSITPQENSAQSVNITSDHEHILTKLAFLLNRRSVKPTVNTTDILAAFINERLCTQATQRAFDNCSQSYIDMCLNSKASVIKSIRLSMAHIGAILERDPDVKVLYLIRDPRAIAQSRISTKLSARTARMRNYNSIAKEEKLINEANLLCRKMSDDLRKFDVLQKRYPNSLKQVVYENIARSPFQHYEDMYIFAGLNRTRSMVKWLKGRVSSERNNSDFGTKRQNATETSLKWKTTIDRTALKIATNLCKDTLSRMGYQ